MVEVQCEDTRAWSAEAERPALSSAKLRSEAKAEAAVALGQGGSSEGLGGLQISAFAFRGVVATSLISDTGCLLDHMTLAEAGVKDGAT